MADEKVVGRFEMLWDCGFCGKTRLLGLTHRHCPECGAAQDETKRYFPADGEKVAVADDYAGNDKICPACQHPNGSKTTFCATCGSPLDEAAAAKQRQVQYADKKGVFAADDVKRAEAELTGKGTVKPAKKKSWTWLYILITVALVIFAIWFLCIRTRTAEFEVTEQRWKYVVDIETYKEVEEENWRDQVPAGASVRRCVDKRASSKQEPDGEDCTMKRVDKGDGTFEERQECKPKYRNVDVMKPWCTYALMKWVKTEEKVASGGPDEKPVFPETGVTPMAQIQGAKREGARRQIYAIDLKDSGGKSHTCEWSDKDAEARWKKFTKGTAVKGEVRARSEAVVCDELTVKK